jgi:hypothetical protein
MTTRGFALPAVAVVLLVSRAASAQAQYTTPDSPAWLADRRYNEGIGIRTGNFELHPGIAGEFGYDSNYLMRSTTDGVTNGPPTAPVIPSLEFRITPSLYLSTLGNQRKEGDTAERPPLAFRAGFNLTYREFIGISSDPVASNSNNDIGSQRNASMAADARMDILPGRTVGGAVFASYARAILPNTIDANPDLSFNQDNIGVGGEVSVQPGGGTLDWHLGYQLHDDIFETSEGRPYDNLTHEAYTRGRWAFRPHTALIYDATLRFVSYPNASEGATALLQSSEPIRTRIGMNGLITDRFSVLAMIGWGASFYNNAVPNQPQFDSVIAQAELRWFLAASPGIAKIGDLGLTLSSVALGYSRDFQNSLLGGYYVQDRGYLQFYYLFAGRAAVSLEGGVAAIEYPTLFWADGTERHDAFTDVRADATLFGEYRFTNTFGLNTTLRFTTNVSNQLVNVSEVAPPTGSNSYAMQWNRFEAYVGVRWFM